MKAFLGLLSLVVAFIAYIPYLKDLFAHKTKPHAFSWLVWTVLAGIAFGIQVTHNAGFGSWLMGLSTLLTALIFVLSIRFGEDNIVLTDWLSLAFAGLALALWLITKEPLTAVIIVALIDAVGGFVPTLRKSIKRPFEETPSMYFLYGVSLCFSLGALKEFTLVNALYPASFVLINWFMFVFLLIMRKSKGSSMARKVTQ